MTNASSRAISAFHRLNLLTKQVQHNILACVTICPDLVGLFYRCSSPVGRQGGKQPLNLATTCVGSLGQIEHEVLHSLGIHHEQSRPDRDAYVTIIEENIQPKMLAQFEELPDMDTYNTGYDINSVMHYAFNDFAKHPSLPTIIPKTGKGAKMGQRAGISYLDAAKLQAAYGCLFDGDHGKLDLTAFA